MIFLFDECIFALAQAKKSVKMIKSLRFLFFRRFNNFIALSGIRDTTD
ncbi:hypothetical protein M23134_01953 [Microscilla marina ATCC 23134]|uniref:Uncharacterized protein n=1 Tax=Microscilla marina ATCC 23134 TaxID=313606 RepID=A1ZCC1_MICM2|nr:hypothetical protein M23134_01953 [Microscilla marina ATCC 23134]